MPGAVSPLVEDLVKTSAGLGLKIELVEMSGKRVIPPGADVSGDRVVDYLRIPGSLSSCSNEKTRYAGVFASWGRGLLAG